ncbi:MAG TPA: N-6 DNA methylase [Verrucomicrobiae bacterium]|nr:N-6 DNA methylase [Verrucomicrobiae bacterium]
MINVHEKRLYGIYYTPRPLSEMLCAWAVRSPHDLVFEPSFGGCVFIESILSAFRKLNCPKPQENIYGCDTDESAFRYLDSAISNFNTDHFIRDDFLRLHPGNFRKTGFDILIGNPPYVSLHNMPCAQKQTASLVQNCHGIVVDRRASLWAYFLVHGLSFLNEGGRLCFVLPGSLIQTDYGKKLLHQLSAHFAKIAVLSIAERYFKRVGADESTEILLCEGWKKGEAKKGIEVASVTDTNACRERIANWQKGAWTGFQLNGQAASHLINSEGDKILKAWAKRSFGKRLSSFVTIRIGVVTGANKFFILSQKSAKDHELPGKALKFILTKAKFSKGLFLTTSDSRRTKSQGQKCLLINTLKASKDKNILKYLDAFPKTKIKNNKTFSKQKVWHQPILGKIPDGFLTYMNHHSPRLFLNEISANSTNTIHRIYFNKDVSYLNKLLVVISFNSTLSQLSAELEGRVYGSGVLKHEPSEAKNILIIIPKKAKLGEARDAARRIDIALRNNLNDTATTIADDYLKKAIPTIWTAKKLLRLRAALAAARKRRYPKPQFLNCQSV